MASIHNALRRGGLSHALTSAVGDTKAEGGLERYGETLQPVIDLWSLPEWAFLREEAICGGQFFVTSAAGTLSEALLMNPTNSGFLLILKRVHWTFTSAGTQTFFRRLNQGTLPAGFVATNSGPLDFRDARLIAVPSTVGVVAQAANAAADGGIAFDSFSQAVNERIEDTQPVVIAPGTGFLVTVSAVGVNTMIGGFRWLERRLLTSEV